MQALARFNLIVQSHFKTIVWDLAFLSQYHELQHLLSEGAPSAHLGHVASDFLKLCKERGIYDQVRYIDKSGREVLRANYNGGKPSLVGASQLQDKSRRYYFLDTIALGRNDVYVSPLDLNIEHAEIERPYKPMIRFGTPVYDSKGNKRGAFILNYLADNMLQEMRRAYASSSATVMLLNKEGYWLLSPEPSEEWGFMFGNDKRFSVRYPEVWNAISEKTSGHLETPQGTVSFITISPLESGWLSSTGSPEAFLPSTRLVNSEEYYWKAVSFIPTEVFSAKSRGLLITLFATYLGCVLFYSGFLWRYLRVKRKKKIMEERIAASENSLAEAQRIARLGNWDWDIRKNRIYWSKEIYRIFGLEQDQFDATYEAFLDFVHPADRALVQDSVREAIADRKSYDFDHRIILPDGSERVVHERAVVDFEKGEAVFMRGTVQDVTESRQQADKLAYSQRYLKSIIDTEPECVKLLEPDGTLLEMNPAGLRMIEAESLDQVRGRNVCDLVAQEDRGAFLATLKKVCGGSPEHLQFRIVGLKGTERYLDSTAAPFYDEQKGRNLLLGVTRDVTLQKAMEDRLKASLAEREVLIKEIHHRVKNNLSIIQSLLSLQSSQTSDAFSRGVLTESKNRVRAMGLIHEKLYRSKDLSSLDFSGYMRDLAGQLFDNYCTDKGKVSLRIDIPRVSVDIDTIIPCGLIVNELVTNSLKYAFPEGRGGEIYLGIESDELGLQYLVVRDNGLGLPEGFDIRKASSLGSKIVEALSRQIGADVIIRTGKGGTEFKVLLLKVKLKPLEWVDSQYLLGHEVIDTQHKALYRALESLGEAIKSGRHEEGTKEIIPALLEYVGEHFKTEESYMAQYGYPGSEPHLKAHRDFEQTVGPIVADIQGGRKGLSLTLYDFLAEWLTSHFGGYDRELGEFLKERGLSGGSGLPSAQPRPKEAPCQILALEDDLLAQMSMRRFLEKNGYTYKMASGGKEALEILKATDFGLIISDVSLPDMDGVEVIDKARGLGIKTPVLFLTGKDVAETERRAAGLGVVGVLPKPVSFQDLRKLLSEHFKK